MIKKIKEQSVPYTIMTIAILAFAVFFLCKCWIHYAEVPYAVNEFREGADVQLTEAFLKGEIPYRAESLDKAGMPPVIYQYSFLNSAVSALFALLLGGRVVLAHYLVAILSMIGSAVLVYLLIDRDSQQTVTPLLGATLSLFCHWRFGYLSTSPISLGIFLTLLTFTLAVSKKVKYKALLLAFLCVILFYTKLYYITIAGAIFIYFLFYDRAEAFQFFGMSICLGALSVLLVQFFWPLYFTYSLYLINGTTLWQAASRLLSLLQPAKTGMAHTILPAMIRPQLFSLPAITRPLLMSDATKYVFEQFGYVIVAFFLLFVILLFGLVMIPVRKKKIGIKKNDVLSLAVIQVIVQGLCMLVLGRGDGAYLSYYLQLWMPYVIITAMILVQKDLWLSNKLLNIGMLAFLSLVLLYFGYKKLPLHMKTAEEKDAWKQAKAYVEAQGEKEIYYDPVLSYLAMERGERAYYNGHTGIVYPVTKELLDQDKNAQMVFPYAKKILDVNFAYQEQMKEKVRNHTYALVAVDDEKVCVDDGLLLENGYEQIDELPLAVGNAVYDVRFYVPKEE